VLNNFFALLAAWFGLSCGVGFFLLSYRSANVACCAVCSGFFVFSCDGCLTALAFPCILIGLLASPLCGAALTFLCRRKEK
jgi:hypothetical protein